MRDDMYVTRVRPVQIDYDFHLGDLIVDGTWHALSFASIVPPHAQAMNIHQKLEANPVNASSTIYLRPTSSVSMIATCSIRPQVGLLPNGGHTVIGLNSTRDIEYRILPAGNLSICTLTVKGWWI